MKNKIHFKKILNAFGLLAVAAPISLSVVACGKGSTNPEMKPGDKLALSEALVNLDVASDTTEANLIARVLQNNPETIVTEADLIVANFTGAQPGAQGKATLVAKDDSKFTGSVEVMIVAKDKLALSEALVNLDVASDTTEVNLIARVLQNNPETTVTEADLILENFNKPTKTKAGSAQISAVANSKYEGTIQIKIEVLLTKEEALEWLKNVDRDNLNYDTWVFAWLDYFRLVREEIVTSPLEFNQQDLETDEILKEAFILKIQQLMESDLKRWEIPQEYNLEWLKNSDFSFYHNSEKRTISTLGNIVLQIYRFVSGIKAPTILSQRFDAGWNYKIVQ